MSRDCEQGNASKMYGGEFSEEEIQLLTMLMSEDSEFNNESSDDYTAAQIDTSFSNAFTENPFYSTFTGQDQSSIAQYLNIQELDQEFYNSSSVATAAIFDNLVDDAISEILTESSVAEEDEGKAPSGTVSLGKSKHKFCIAPGCSNMARVGGVCVSHGAKLPKCNYSSECSNVAVNGGVCTKHGAVRNNKKCSELGCNKEAKKGGICYTHGAKRKKCFIPECKNVAVKGGACNKHEKESKVCQPCSPLL
jgi:hypothetical protein